MSVSLNEDAIPEDSDYKGGRKSRRGGRVKDNRGVFTSYPVPGTIYISSRFALWLLKYVGLLLQILYTFKKLNKSSFSL